VVRGGLEWAAHGEQEGAGVGGDGGGGAQDSGQVESRNGMEWGERELVLLLNQKRGGEGACTGSATAAARWRWQSRGMAWHVRKRAREEELERRSG
jgi:hypothetical protein